MPTAKRSASARTPAPPPKPTAKARKLERELHEARTEIRAIRAKAALRRLKESAALDYDWVSPWQALLQQRDTEPGWFPLGSSSARRHGTNFPFYQTEQQLGMLRDLSRIVVGTNNNAAGLLRGYNAFVIGTGFATKVAAKPGTNDRGEAAAGRITTFLDAWSKLNNWPERQQELGRRTERDGDGILRLFPDDGWLKARFVWPEQITQPPGGTFEDWSFGIHWTETEDGPDCESIEEVYVARTDEPEKGDFVPAKEIVLFQPECDAGVKRRVPLFAFGMREVLDTAGRLTRNLGEGSAVRAAIAYMRQHAAAGESDVEAMNFADADFREKGYPGDTYRAVNVGYPGMVVDFPEGMEHVPQPVASDTAANSAVVDLLIRSACARINAPEWLGSSNAANMGAYTSSLVAESPFVKGIVGTQGYYRSRFLRVIDAALETAAAHGVIERSDLELVTVDLIPPSPIVRNKVEEAQTASIEIPLGVDSRQRYCESQDRDYERVSQENKQYADGEGAPGDPLPDELPPDEGGASAPTDAGDGSDPSDLRGTVGGLQAITNLQQQFYSGQIPQAAAIASLQTLFGFSPDEAAAMLPAVEPVKRTDDGQGDQGGGGDDPFAGMMTEEALEEIEGVRVLREADAPPGKVWKEITYNRGGKQVTQKRLVNAPQAKKERPAAKKEDPKPKGKPAKADPKETAAAVKAQLAGDPAKLTPAKVRDLDAKLATLTVDQLKALKKEHDLKGGKTKADHVAALVKRAKELKKKADAERKAGKKTVPAPAAKPEPVAEPTPAPAPKESPTAHPASAKLVTALNAAPNLTDEQREYYGRSLARVVQSMPKAALDRIDAHVGAPTFYAKVDDIGPGLVEAVSTRPGMTPEQTAESRKKYAFLAEEKCGGCYLSFPGSDEPAQLHLDGDQTFAHVDWGRHNRTGAGHTPLAHSIYAHELGHAIDGPTKEITRSAEWQDAFKSEIEHTDADYNARLEPKLTRYAGKKDSEGLAEFSRLVYGSDVPHAQVARDFAKATAVFKARGLWPEKERGGAEGKMTEVFDKRVEIGTDGSHADTLLKGGGM